MSDRVISKRSSAGPMLNGVYQPEAAKPNDGTAAIGVSRGRELGSRCLTRSSHRFAWQRGCTVDRYRWGCSHPAWKAAGTRSNGGGMSAARRAELTLSTLIGHIRN